MGGPPWRVVEVTCAAEEKKLKLSLAEHWSWKKIGDLKAAVAKKLHAPPSDLGRQSAAAPLDRGPAAREGRELDAEPRLQALQEQGAGPRRAQARRRVGRLRPPLQRRHEHAELRRPRAPRPPVSIRAARADVAAQACPATSKILEDFSQAHTALHGSAYFSLLAPRTHIRRHCGPTNARLRLHLGLVVPDGCSIRVGDEVRTWVEGRCLLFDDSFEHEVWNDADEERLVLIVDVWHPDLKTDDQRKRHLEKELHGAYDHLKTARFWRDTTESGH